MKTAEFKLIRCADPAEVKARQAERANRLLDEFLNASEEQSGAAFLAWYSLLDPGLTLVPTTYQKGVPHDEC